MTAALTGEPLIISVKRYERLIGHRIDPTQCSGTISRAAFESAFTRYLLWELEYDGQCSLKKLERRIHPDPFHLIQISKEDRL